MGVLQTIGSSYNVYLDFSATNEFLRGRAAVTLVSQNASSKVSTLDVKLYLYKTTTVITGSTVFRGLITCGTQESYQSATIDLGSSEVLVYSGTHLFQHNVDGTGSIDFSVSDYYGTRPTSTDSEILTLPVIVSGSVLNVDPTGMITVGSTTVSLSIDTPDLSWTHVIKIKNLAETLSYTVTTLGSGVLSYSFTPSASLMGFLMPNNATEPLYVECTSYTGGTQLGTSKVARTFHITSSSAPTVATPTVSPVDVAGSSVPYGYIAGVTYLQMSWSGSSPTGATIVSANSIIDGVSYNPLVSNSAVSMRTSKPVGSSGSKTIYVSMTDSRGYTTLNSVVLTVISYNLPRITSLSVMRSLSDGTPSMAGSYALVNYSYDVTQLGTYNRYNLLLQYKSTQGVTWTTVFSYSNLDTDFVSSNFSVLNLGVIDGEYDVRLTLSDTLSGSSTVASRVLGTESVMINFPADGSGVAFGKLAELSGVADFGYLLKLSGGLYYTPILAGTDLNTLQTPNFFRGTTTDSLVHYPSAVGGTFGLQVVSTGESTVAQLLYPGVSSTTDIPYIYVRSRTITAWTSWYRISLTEVI